jgi:hypothetical protein
MKWDAFITILAPHPAHDLSRPPPLYAILSDWIKFAGKGFQKLPHIGTRKSCNRTLYCPLKISLKAKTYAVYALVLTWEDGVRNRQGTAKVRQLKSRIVCKCSFSI